jgi:hypothetical protein
VIYSAATHAFAALSATRLRATLRLSLHEGSPFNNKTLCSLALLKA